MNQSLTTAKTDSSVRNCRRTVGQGGAAIPTQTGQVNCELAESIVALTSQVQTLTTKVTELSTQTAAAAVGAAGQTGVPTYTHHPSDSIRRTPP